MYIYKYIITGSLGLKILFFLTLLSLVIVVSILLRRIGVLNIVSQVANEINVKINDQNATLEEVYSYEKSRIKLHNPVSNILILSYEEFVKKTSYDIL